VIAEAVLRGWVVGYTAAAATAIVRAAARTAPTREPRQPLLASDAVVLVRPLAGDEPGLAERLARTGGARFVIFAVGRRNDTAEPVAQAAAAKLRMGGVDAIVLVTGARAANHKADQLARALATPLARLARTVVVADSDVELEPDGVAHLVRAMGDADAAWAPPVEVGVAETWGDRASQAILDASLHSFPLLAGIDPSGLVGKLFAVRRRALDAIGGFGALCSHLGEDMELARRLREAGRSVIVAPQLARSTARGRSLRNVLARYRRWLLVVRMQRPHLLLSYPLLLAPSPLLVAVLAVALIAHAPSLATVAAAGLAARVGVACAARALAGLPFAPAVALLQALAGDLVLLACAIGACGSREVTWRGRRLRFTREGTLYSRGKETHEEALGDSTDDARAASEHRLEAASRDGAVGPGARGDRRVDARELVLDPLALPRDADRNVALASRVPGERPAERDPELGVLGPTEHVAKPDRDDEGPLRDAGDLRGPRSELERGERRPLATLGKDPEDTAGSIEETHGMTDGPRAVGRVVEVDAERPDAPEERQASQVRRIHHRVPVASEEELGDVQRDEGVPPRRVIGDDEEGRTRSGGTSGLQAGDLHASEGVTDARARVPREPGIEPATLRGADHGVTS
jgi:ceramide glucosyltransferase